MTEFWSRK